jgi:hypothetical protein
MVFVNAGMLSGHALPLHDRSGSIQPAEAATVLSQINAENRDLHWHALLPVGLLNLHGLRREAVIP